MPALLLFPLSGILGVNEGHSGDRGAPIPTQIRAGDPPSGAEPPGRVCGPGGLAPLGAAGEHGEPRVEAPAGSCGRQDWFLRLVCK